MRFLKSIPLIIILLSSFCFAKAPEVTPKEVRKKVKEILKAHVSYKKMTPELMARVINNYIEEIDYTKTYLLESELSQWTTPSKELLDRAVANFHSNDFSIFAEIHKVMIQAVSRREKLEASLEKVSVPETIKEEDLEESRAKTSDDLKTKLLKVKSLQMQAAKTIEDESCEKFFQRIKKRRLNRESDLIGDTEQEQERIVLSFFLKAFTSALDPYTTYFTPAEASQFMIHVQQRLFGIGAQLKDSLNGFTIVRILEGGPASKDNLLKINDKIIAVNHTPVVGMDIAEAVELIRGEKGTNVLLTVLREHAKDQIEKVNIELVRGEVVLEETRLETKLEPYADGVIAIVRLFSFYQDPKSSSADDIKKSLEKIRENHNLKGVVLDLRNNSGGLLPQAVAVTSLFIKKGIVVSIKDNTGRVQHLRNTENNRIWEGPLMVLVNKASASAAEIVAQTLKDYGRALLVGDKHTFGKGTFQTFTLDAAHDGKVNPQGEYKVTRGKYYTVSGKSPQLVGVQPNIVVPGLLSELDIGEKFSKHPLENDEISPNFEDNLSDIPLFHRHQIGKLYKHNLQPKLDLYNRFIDRLKKNSENRIQFNKTFQAFLKEIKEKKFDGKSVDVFDQTDLQLVEMLNIMKDLIFFIQLEQMQNQS